MHSSITLTSPAKLNLFLHINGRRPDGYHDLQTLFQLLDFGDELNFSIRADKRLQLSPSIPGVADEDNLIIKAAKCLQQASNCQLGADITLAKRLPMGGGIGGGSSNAATTLLALNHLWQTELNLDQLATLGQQLGADVPVFIAGHSAFAEGIGEKLQPVPLPERWFLVLVPKCHVSTAKVFAHKDLTRDTPIIKVAPTLERGHQNDCQALVKSLFSEVNEALTWLQQFGDARMTGTGACVFAAFDSKAEAESLLQKIPVKMSAFIAKGVNQSICHRQLLSQQ